MNALTLLRRDDKGGWLDAEDFGEILLPMRQLPATLSPVVPSRFLSIWMGMKSSLSQDSSLTPKWGSLSV